MKDLKTYNRADKLDASISRSNLIKRVLILCTVLLGTIWLVFVIMGVIPFGYELVDGSSEKPLQGDYSFINGLYYVSGTKDINPLYLLNESPLPLLFLIFSPLGYLMVLILVASRYGVLSPIKVGEINRKALSLGYLRQENFDYLIKEMNINTGKLESDDEEDIE